jgi:hypothetical protein
LGEGKKLSELIPGSHNLDEAMLVELDGCEIRTGVFAPAEYQEEAAPPNRKKILRWRPRFFPIFEHITPLISVERVQRPDQIFAVQSRPSVSRL